jgi:hypothetical protein
MTCGSIVVTYDLGDIGVGEITSFSSNLGFNTYEWEPRMGIFRNINVADAYITRGRVEIRLQKELGHLKSFMTLSVSVDMGGYPYSGIMIYSQVNTKTGKVLNYSGDIECVFPYPYQPTASGY